MNNKLRAEMPEFSPVFTTADRKKQAVNYFKYRSLIPRKFREWGGGSLIKQKMVFETIMQYAALTKIYYFCQILSQQGCANTCNGVAVC